MLITADNLSGVVTSCNICPPALVEEHSICIRLDAAIYRMLPHDSGRAPVIYGQPYEAATYFSDLERIADRDLTLKAGARVLACSQDHYAMPAGYFGLVQTKGSLARLFVSATCNDGQVEPGYRGKITLELSNIGNLDVAIPVGSIVAQLFLFRCSTVSRPYAGQYQNADKPTLADFSFAQRVSHAS